jgi:two-component system NarL family sensor kinase
LSEKSSELSPRALELQKLLEEAIVQVRNLSQELNPAMVERAGLKFGLERLAARRQASFSGTLRLEIDAAVRLPATVATAVYRIAEQALDNAVRHAGCSWIEVLVRPVEGVATLEVIDDGRGFSVEEAREQRRGLGLQLMRYHATHAGLQLSITSASGKGTIVRVDYRAPESRER